MHLSLTRCTYVIAFYLMLCNSTLVAQTTRPVPPGSIAFELNENGKIKKKPPGFALVKDEAYDFNILVDADINVHTQLLVLFREKLLKTYQKITDPASTNSKFYELLFGSDFSTYKSELAELIQILKTKDPQNKLDSSSSTFTYFGGKAFLVKALFTENFIAHVNKEAQVVKAYNQPATLTVPSGKLSRSSFDVLVRVRDMEKNLIVSYYNHVRAVPAIDALLTTTNTESYYNLPNVPDGYTKMLNDVLQHIDRDKAYICDDGVFGKYKELRGLNLNLKAASILKIVDSDWLKYMAWLNEGEVRMNPFNFTDKFRLRFNFGTDTLSADLRDEYIKSLIDLMIDSKDLNTRKVSVKLFDSLLLQQDKGKEMFSFKKDNEQLVITNAANAKSFLQADKAISQTTFRLVEADQVNNYLLQVYHPEAGIMVRDGSVLKGSFSNEVKVETMTYNLSQNEAFNLKVTSAPHSGESKAITGLKKVGGLGSELSTQILPLLGPFATVFTAKNTVDPRAVGNIPLIPKKASKPGGENAVTTSMVRAALQDDGAKLYILYTEDKDLLRRLPLFAIADSWLDENNVSDCGPLRSLLYEKIRKQFAGYKATYSSDEKRRINADIDGIFKNLLGIVNQVAQDWAERKTAPILEFLTEELKNTQLLTVVSASKDLTFPPDELTLTDDSDEPVYRNQFNSLPAEDGPKIRSITASLVDTKGKVLDSLNEKFVSSSPDWVTGSLGVAYVMNKFRRSDASVTDGVLNNVADEEQVRLIAGLHFYPWPILLSDDRFIGQLKWREIPHRIGFFLGFSFPKAFSNPHVGISFDIWPGVKTTAGAHLYRYTGYEIMNDQIVDQNTRYRVSGAFISLNLEPVTFVKLIGLFK